MFRVKHHRTLKSLDIGRTYLPLDGLEEGVMHERILDIVEGGYGQLSVAVRIDRLEGWKPTPNFSFKSSVLSWVFPSMSNLPSRKLKNFRLFLNKTEFSPGDVVRGTIVLSSSYPVSLSLRCYGRQTCKVTLIKTSSTKSLRWVHNSFYSFFDTTIQLLNENDLSVGMHVFPFEFQLPTYLPSSGKYHTSDPVSFGLHWDAQSQVEYKFQVVAKCKPAEIQTLSNTGSSSSLTSNNTTLNVNPAVNTIGDSGSSSGFTSGASVFSATPSGWSRTFSPNITVKSRYAPTPRILAALTQLGPNPRGIKPFYPIFGKKKEMEIPSDDIRVGLDAPLSMRLGEEINLTLVMENVFEPRSRNASISSRPNGDPEKNASGTNGGQHDSGVVSAYFVTVFLDQYSWFISHKSKRWVPFVKKNTIQTWRLTPENCRTEESMILPCHPGGNFRALLKAKLRTDLPPTIPEQISPLSHVVYFFRVVVENGPIARETLLRFDIPVYIFPQNEDAFSNDAPPERPLLNGYWPCNPCQLPTFHRQWGEPSNSEISERPISEYDRRVPTQAPPPSFRAPNNTRVQHNDSTGSPRTIYKTYSQSHFKTGASITSNQPLTRPNNPKMTSATNNSGNGTFANSNTMRGGGSVHDNMLRELRAHASSLTLQPNSSGGYSNSQYPPKLSSSTSMKAHSQGGRPVSSQPPSQPLPPTPLESPRRLTGSDEEYYSDSPSPRSFGANRSASNANNRGGPASAKRPFPVPPPSTAKAPAPIAKAPSSPIISPRIGELLTRDTTTTPDGSLKFGEEESPKMGSPRVKFSASAKITGDRSGSSSPPKCAPPPAPFKKGIAPKHCGAVQPMSNPSPSRSADTNDIVRDDAATRKTRERRESIRFLDDFSIPSQGVAKSRSHAPSIPLPPLPSEASKSECSKTAPVVDPVEAILKPNFSPFSPPPPRPVVPMPPESTEHQLLMRSYFGVASEEPRVEVVEKYAKPLWTAGDGKYLFAPVLVAKIAPESMWRFIFPDPQLFDLYTEIPLRGWKRPVIGDSKMLLSREEFAALPKYSWTNDKCEGGILYTGKRKRVEVSLLDTSRPPRDTVFDFAASLAAGVEIDLRPDPMREDLTVEIDDLQNEAPDGLDDSILESDYVSATD